MKLNSIVLNEMNKQLNRIEACLSLLSDEQVWHRYKPNMNSIGNLCLHLAGNEYQHFVSGIGKAPFIRARSEEFTINDGLTGNELIRLLKDVRRQSSSILEAITESDLTTSVTIQYTVEDWNKMIIRPVFETMSNYSRDLETLLIQVCEHYSYHAGQVVVLTKLLIEKEDNITGTYH
ncbi:DinB family protein [Paenibacillus sp. HJGM_3]|uniref:DinB family protein n=1 Tax=Paenibacillus sp. HJGM_3 TaxID=3379816 RepID=UPI0038589FA4